MLILVVMSLCAFLLWCTHIVQDDRNIYVLVPEDKFSDLRRYLYLLIVCMLLSGKLNDNFTCTIECLLVDDIPESSEHVQVPYKLVSLMLCSCVVHVHVYSYHNQLLYIHVV